MIAVPNEPLIGKYLELEREMESLLDEGQAFDQLLARLDELWFAMSDDERGFLNHRGPGTETRVSVEPVRV